MAQLLTAAGLDRIDSVVDEHVADDKVPGLVALVACGEQVHVRAQGSLTIGGPPVARDSLFRIASTTKPIAAATAMALIDEGLIGLDEPVDKLLPELAGRQVLRSLDGPIDDTVPAARPITTRDLLTFTFGFGMVFELYASPTPLPIVVAESELPLSTLGPPGFRCPPGSRHLDRRARLAAADGPARRAVDVQHRSHGARRAAGPGGRPAGR